MKGSPIDWKFPSTGGGEEDGVNDAGLELFEGDHAAFLAREVIQNSIDAKRPECQHVEVRFRLASIKLDDFPRWPAFKQILRACHEEVKAETGRKHPAGRITRGEELYQQALSLSSPVSVLIIEDFNTTGLCGGESAKDGQWYRCIRKKGSNVPAGEGGGTFGIGKHAPFPASKLRTVFYSTINDKRESAFIGKAILSSFELDGDMKRGAGFYGALQDGKVVGIRDTAKTPPFFRRKEQGLSIFVAAYRHEGDWKSGLLKAVLANFYAAIDAGKLKVVFEDKDGDESVDSATLEPLMKAHAPDSLQYLYALRRPHGGKPVEGTVAHIGKVKLYLAHGKDFEKKVAFMRRPLILVETKHRKIVHEPFAGVFICDDPAGSDVLGRLEPPTHNTWDRNRDPANGSNIMIRLMEWLNAELRKLNADTSEETEDVADLADYIPEGADLPGERTAGGTGDEPSPAEAAEEIGKERESEPVVPVATKKMAPLRRTAGGGGKGARKRHGKRKIKTPRGSGPGPGGRLRSTIDLGVRWIPNRRDGNKAVVIVRAEEPFKGSLRIIGLAEEGNYDIKIKSARIYPSGASFEIRDDTISGVEIEPGRPAQILVDLSESAWQAVSVEAYGD